MNWKVLFAFVISAAFVLGTCAWAAIYSDPTLPGLTANHHDGLHVAKAAPKSKAKSNEKKNQSSDTGPCADQQKDCKKKCESVPKVGRKVCEDACDVQKKECEKQQQ